MCSSKRAHRGEGVALLDEELAQLGAADARDLPGGKKGRDFTIEHDYWVHVGLHQSKPAQNYRSVRLMCGVGG